MFYSWTGVRWLGLLQMVVLAQSQHGIFQVVYYTSYEFRRRPGEVSSFHNNQDEPLGSRQVTQWQQNVSAIDRSLKRTGGTTDL